MPVGSPAIPVGFEARPETWSTASRSLDMAARPRLCGVLAAIDVPSEMAHASERMSGSMDNIVEKKAGQDFEAPPLSDKEKNVIIAGQPDARRSLNSSRV
jgi:hypothetical protein